MLLSALFLSFISLPGGPEWFIIFVVILLLFGAKKIPELARGLGKSMGEFKKAREEFEHEITRASSEVTQPTQASLPKKAPHLEEGSSQEETKES